MAFIAFGKLPLGAHFSARGNQWVKAPEFAENGKKINAYSPNFDETKTDPTTTTDYFDEAMLVRPDPEGKMAAWADDIEPSQN